MLYLVFEAYDDFWSAGKTPILLKRKEEDAIAFCKKSNIDSKIDWIEDCELKGNPGDRDSGFFYTSIEIDE